jgi:hypothetical protein
VGCHAFGKFDGGLGLIRNGFFALAATTLQYVAIRHRPAPSLAAENIFLRKAVGVVSKARDQAEGG